MKSKVLHSSAETIQERHWAWSSRSKDPWLIKPLTRTMQERILRWPLF